VSERYLNEILHIFKGKNEFITFHNTEDQNAYVDTKEEENNKIRDEFINRLFPLEKSQNFVACLTIELMK
jgi:hypothetical protein